MHTFYQRYPSEDRWTKDHPLEQVIGNPSQSVRTRRQLESDAEMCMFALAYGGDGSGVVRLMVGVVSVVLQVVVLLPAAYRGEGSSGGGGGDSSGGGGGE
nr:integrase, catalytic region, zinc finger, CCHC-type, peptidase aspartic, catalytic [Tanacetum cinerariifolium]